MSTAAPVFYAGTSCDLAIARPAPHVFVLTISGNDVGEFGSAPMDRLAALLPAGEPVALFIDARDTRGASIEVSGDWAVWLARHRDRFHRISMLTGSRFVQITAGFVRNFAELGDRMRLYTDAAAFDEALAEAVATRA